MRERQAMIESIIQYFRENEDVFNECIEELDSYNGYLGDDRYYEMEMINEFYMNTDPIDILYRAFYGHDDTYTIDKYGDREYGEFNPNRDYFRYNGYDNLVSTDYKDYSNHLDKYFIEALLENRIYIDSIDYDDTLTELFDELENIQED